jgi:hypothetical protein
MGIKFKSYVLCTLCVLFPTLSLAGTIVPDLQVRNQGQTKIEVLKVCLSDGVSCVNASLLLEVGERGFLYTPSGSGDKLRFTIFSKRYGCSKQLVTLEGTAEIVVNPIIQDIDAGRHISRAACQRR